MARRSSRLIYAFWDDRDETYWDHCIRRSRQTELCRDLPPLWDAPTYFRRTLYSYGKRARAKGFRLGEARANNFFMRTTAAYRPGPVAGEYALMRRAMAMLITCWEPYVCGVRTKALDALVPDPGPFRAAWILYVHPALAGTVVASNIPVVEPAPDGGLVLAATTRPFKAEDPKHLDVAQRIAAAVAHLNVEHSSNGNTPANPWPPLTNRFVGEHRET